MILDRVYVAKAYPQYFLADQYSNLHRVVKQYLWNRELRDEKAIEHFLNYTVPHETSPLLLKDAYKAALRIWQAIDDKHPILIFGDYDADGVTATSLLTEFLKTLGASVNWFIPSRSDGYGMSDYTTTEALSMYTDTKLFITVDNGIKSGQVVNMLVEKGIDVIVTDHHIVGDNLADFPSSAYAVINPQQSDCQYPEKLICGCAVAYKLAHALMLTANEAHHHLDLPDLYHEKFLDLVAIGTVADVMPLTAPENRYFVKRGIEIMKSGGRCGLDCMFDIDQYLSKEDLTAETIGFSIAPQINAASRVDHPRWAMYLLQADTKADALSWALKVAELNATRKQIQSDISKQVDKQLLADEDILDLTKTPVIMQKIDECPHGIIGLVAGDLSRRYSRPAIVFTRSSDDVWVASARSVTGFSVTDALEQCSDLLISHGGHEMSAGLKVANAHFDELKQCLTTIALPYIELFKATSLTADVEIGLHEIDDGLYNIVQFLDPMAGQSCPIVTFASLGVTVSSKVAFSHGKHLKLTVTDNKGNIYPAIWWKMGHLVKSIPDQVDIVYRLGKDTYGGKSSLRLMIESIAEHKLNC